ncbi:MAG: sigma-70 family RNA polymerase sigma factor [Bacteroidota bacterium]
MKQLKHGSESAFTQLFNSYRGAVYSTSFTFLNSVTLAEEVVQDVFLKIWLKRAEIGEIKHLQGYLFIMARNIIFDRIKKMSYESTISGSLAEDQISAGGTDYLIRHHQCQQFLKQAIEQLPPQQQKIYCLAKEDGLSHERIADIMKISKQTVKKHMALALRSIRKYLDNHIHNFLWLMVLLHAMVS